MENEIFVVSGATKCVASSWRNSHHFAWAEFLQIGPELVDRLHENNVRIGVYSSIRDPLEFNINYTYQIYLLMDLDDNRALLLAAANQ